MEQQIGVIIVAGGGGTRMGGSRPKQFMMLGGLPVLAHTINNFAGALPGAEIVVVLPAEHADFWKDFAARFDIAAHTVTTGGDERFHSVKNGLKALKRDPELIAVQDGVRPLASHGMIRRAVAAAAEHGTAIPVVEAVDSYRETDGTASRIADRRRLRIVQTPQVFRADILRRAYEAEYRPEFTDDASVVEQAGEAVFLCEGERTNLKITTPKIWSSPRRCWPGAKRQRRIRMEKTYKYRFSRRAIYWTLVYLVVFVLLGWLLYHLYEGGYLSAWFTSFIVALIALMSLSIPRRIVVTDEKVEVRCLLDITEIRRDEIASVRRVDPRRMKWFFPVFGGCGFFGYYGHFLDLRRFERVKLYASEWKNFVEITDIYEDRLYVSCSDADRLVEELMPPGGNRPAEDDEEEEQAQ